MAKRRSPNYPAVSFPEAMEMAKAIYAKAQRHKTDKESLAKIIGYNSLNGKSLRLLGTLNAHGLLSGTKSEMGITEYGESAIVDPEGSESRYEAVVECAYKPAIYFEIMKRYDFNPPGDELIRAHVLKSGYSQSAAETIIRNLRDTIEYVEHESMLTNPAYQQRKAESMMPPEAQPAAKQESAPSLFMPPAAKAVDERELFSYDFEPSGSLRLLVSADVDTVEALEVLQELVEMKRREVERKARKAAGKSSTPAPERDGDEDS